MDIYFFIHDVMIMEHLKLDGVGLLMLVVDCMLNGFGVGRRLSLLCGCLGLWVGRLRSLRQGEFINFCVSRLLDLGS